MTYQQHTAPRPSSPSTTWTWVAIGLATLGVLLGVIGAITVSAPPAACTFQHEMLDRARSAQTRNPTTGNQDVLTDARTRVASCESDAADSASDRASTLGTLAVIAFLGAAGAGVMSYNTSPAARERKRQRAWSAYYAAQQAPQTFPVQTAAYAPQQTPQSQPTEPVDYDTGQAFAEPEVEIPWYLKGDK